MIRCEEPGCHWRGYTTDLGEHEHIDHNRPRGRQPYDHYDPEGEAADRESDRIDRVNERHLR